MATRGRWILVVGAVALAGFSAWMTWWMTTLSGLPDIGDPFDVEAFLDSPVSDRENAYVLYREAVDKLGVTPTDMTYNWAEAGPIEKGWLERNREALEIWRRGTERPKSLYISPRSMTLLTQLPVVQELRTLARLAQLEGGRLEAEGDLEGAWRWYRAIYRSSRHIGHRSTAIERLVGLSLLRVASNKMTHWAADPRTTPEMLRRAIDAAIADFAATGPISDSLKVEYLAFLNTYADPDLVMKCLNDSDSSGLPKPPWFARDVRLFGFMRVFRKEPERSRRVWKLAMANLLSACDLPRDRRPKVACSLPRSPMGGATLDLYEVDESTPASARALPPDQILSWHQSTLFASRLTPAFQSIEGDQAVQATLLMTLANRLYEVERGKPPETVEELGGPYLKTLPEGYKSPE